MIHGTSVTEDNKDLGQEISGLKSEAILAEVWCDSPFIVPAPRCCPARVPPTPPGLIHGMAPCPRASGQEGWQTAHPGVHGRGLFCLLHLSIPNHGSREGEKPALGNRFHPEHDAALLLSPLTHSCPADFPELSILGRFSSISLTCPGVKARQCVPGTRKGWDSSASI